MREVIFSKHSLERIIIGDEKGLRTKMNVFEVRKILSNDDNFIPIGVENGKVYLLFYSIKDSSFYVVVQNNSNGEVITIMSLQNYSDRIPVSSNAIRSARMIMDSDYNPKQIQADLDDIIESAKFLKN